MAKPTALSGSTLVFAAVCGLLATSVGASEDQSSTDHCFRNLYDGLGNSTFMQFTKEAISMDYGVQGSFKSLHCCAKGYRSIEW